MSRQARKLLTTIRERSCLDSLKLLSVRMRMSTKTIVVSEGLRYVYFGPMGGPTLIVVQVVVTTASRIKCQARSINVRLKHIIKLIEVLCVLLSPKQVPKLIHISTRHNLRSLR